MKIKSLRNYEKKNTWNVRRLIDESFVLCPIGLANQPIRLYIVRFYHRKKEFEELILLEGPIKEFRSF